ncbi:MAG: NUDIX domain-containing protein [Pseudonocardiaceae bacterium]
MVEANESPRAAAVRELAEELGLTVPLGRVLAIECAPPHGSWDDQVVFVFDGATLLAERIAGLRTMDAELARLGFVPIIDAAARMRPHIWRRPQRAHTALRTGATDYHERTSEPSTLVGPTDAPS